MTKFNLRKKFEYINMTDWAWPKTRKVRWAMLEICPTWKCNALCLTCGAWKRGKTQKEELSIEQIKQLVYHPRFRHLRDVAIEGGEPSMWGNLKAYMELQLKHSDTIMIGIITNGIKVNYWSEFAEKFKEYNDRVKFYVSLNGDEEVHDASRGVKCYHKTVATAKVLKDYGYRVQFSSITFDQNLDKIDHVVELGKSMGITTNHCYPTNYGRFANEGDWTTDRESEIYEVYRKAQNRLKFLDKWAYDRFITAVSERKVMPCYAGYRYVHVNPIGLLRPCLFDERVSFGQVTDNDVTMNPNYKDVLKRIPYGCQYTDGQLCDDCLVRKSIRSNIGGLLWWKLRKLVS